MNNNLITEYIIIPCRIRKFGLKGRKYKIRKIQTAHIYFIYFIEFIL